jgi:hypothetical protein
VALHFLNNQETIMQNFDPRQDKNETQPYEPPQIIYESQITTRAGSPLSNPSGVDDIDPSDLLGG